MEQTILESKEKREQLKAQLLGMIFGIRGNKLGLKEAQRAFSNGSDFDGERPRWDANNYLVTHSAAVAVTKYRDDVASKKMEFRVLHIVYSMLRGKPIDVIEPGTRMNDQSYIDRRDEAYSKARAILNSLGFPWIQSKVTA
jgi:hypothetical protein